MLNRLYRCLVGLWIISRLKKEIWRENTPGVAEVGPVFYDKDFQMQVYSTGPFGPHTKTECRPMVRWQDLIDAVIASWHKKPVLLTDAGIIYYLEKLRLSTGR